MQQKTDIDKFLGVIFISKQLLFQGAKHRIFYFSFFKIFLLPHTLAMHNLVIYYVAIEIPQSGAFLCLLCASLKILLFVTNFISRIIRFFPGTNTLDNLKNVIGKPSKLDCGVTLHQTILDSELSLELI